VTENSLPRKRGLEHVTEIEAQTGSGPKVSNLAENSLFKTKIRMKEHGEQAESAPKSRLPPSNSLDSFIKL
jgi:hypothetical protein